MARRSYARTRRSTGRSTRSSYRAAAPRRSYKSSRRRASTGRRSSSGGARTIRIVLETNNASGVQRPGEAVGIGMKTAAAPRAKPRF